MKNNKLFEEYIPSNNDNISSVSCIIVNGNLYDWEDFNVAQPFFMFSDGDVVLKPCGETHSDFPKLYRHDSLFGVGRVWEVEGDLIITYIFHGMGLMHFNCGIPNHEIVFHCLRKVIKKTSLNGKNKWVINVWKDKNAIRLKEGKQQCELDKYMLGDEGDGNLGYFHIEENKDSDIGIYINCSSEDFDVKISNGEKTIETRNNKRLDKLVGQRVGLIKTIKNRKPILFGYCTIGKPIVYNKENFDSDYKRHQVGKNSVYHIDKTKNGIKFGYPLDDFEIVEPQSLPKGKFVEGLFMTARYLNLNEDKDIIKEGISSIIYHYTTLDNLISILDDDKFKLHYDSNEDMYFFSTTRQRNSTIGYPSSLGSFYKEKFKECIVRLTLNGDLLSVKYKGKPTVHFDGDIKGGEIGDPQYKNESEDRIFSYEDTIKNATSYITRIDIIFRKEPSYYIGTYYPSNLEWLITNEWSSIINCYFCEDDANKMKNSKFSKERWKYGEDCESALWKIIESEYDDYEINENIEYEVAPSQVDTSSFELEDTLAPRIWDSEKNIDSRLRLKLLDIADDFLSTMELRWVKPIDIILTGSICNYNWSKYSDIDLHIVIDFKEVDSREDLVRDYVDSKKNEWNNEHDDLTAYDYPIELYVQNVSDLNISNGVYSLTKNKWINNPSKDNLHKLTQNEEIKIKLISSSIMTHIDNLCEKFEETDDLHEIEEIGDAAKSIGEKTKGLRTNGLETSGEMSIGNIVYKSLRRKKYLDKIWDLRTKVYDKLNSL